MNTKPKTRKARMGRPPRVVDGVPYGDLPQVNVRLSPDARARLAAMAKATSRRVQQVVQDAVLAAWDALEGDVRKAAERQLRRR